MTRKDAEEIVRSMGRTCRGPCVLPEEEITVWNERFMAADSSGDFIAMTALKEELEAKFEKDFGLILTTTPDFATTAARCLNLIFAKPDTVNRGGCGSDVNDVICANPFDSQRHDFVCPKCGIQNYYIAPWFPLISDGQPEESFDEAGKLVSITP